MSLSLSSHSIRCAPVAVVLARKRLAGEKVEDWDSLEFDVVELADTMGWQLPLVKRGLRQLQWGGMYNTYRFQLRNLEP